MTRHDQAMDVASYYAAHADIYTHINRDRDFEAQVRAIHRLASRSSSAPLRMLEIFAGPAYHAIHGERLLGWIGHALDSSPAMKRAAIGEGFADPSRYLVGDIPDCLPEAAAQGQFDCLFAARFSLGYLDRGSLDRLIHEARSLVAEHGLLVFELHDLSLLAGSLQNLNILERTSLLPDGTMLRCLWPAGSIRWDRDDHLVSMDVEISLDKDGHNERLRFVSTERIYGASEVAHLGRAAGWQVLTSRELGEDTSRAFPDARIVALRRV